METRAYRCATEEIVTHRVRRRCFLALLGGIAAWPFAAEAQQPIPTIGFLSSGSPRAFSEFVAAFRRGLAEHGFIEGTNVRIDYRWAEGNYADLDRLAAELVQNGAALIAATGGVVSAKAAMRATKETPILFVIGFDPVQLGLVESYSRPGHNTTGVSVHTTELNQKRLDLLAQIVPGLSKVGLLVNPGAVTTPLEVENAAAAARSLGYSAVPLLAATEGEITSAFESAVQQRVDALLVAGDPFFNVRRAQIVALAARHRIPASYPTRLFVNAGGLMSYGTEFSWAYQRVGAYAGRILKGMKPGELPVELPTTFDFAINLTAARGLELHIPPEMLALASDVVGQ